MSSRVDGKATDSEITPEPQDNAEQLRRYYAGVPSSAHFERRCHFCEKYMGFRPHYVSAVICKQCRNQDLY